MGAIADTLCAAEKPLMMYAEKLLVGVTPEQFARQPMGKSGLINTNHPAFAYGHMSTYPAWICTIAGVAEPGFANPEGFDALFSHEAVCRDDPEGTIYPSMDAVTGHFFDSHRRLFAHLRGLSDQKLSEPHGQEGDFFKGFPTRAAVVAFMVGPHPFTHIGQVSAWRRCMGLGSAF